MPDDKPQIVISDHAANAMRERGIDPAWVHRVIEQPAKTEPDQLDPNATHALGAIPEFGGRVLRVVYNASATPWRIITAFFDRRMKGRL
jgi:hypothetical protein